MKTVQPEKTTPFFIGSVFVMVLGIVAVLNGINKFDTSVITTDDTVSADELDSGYDYAHSDETPYESESQILFETTETTTTAAQTGSITPIQAEITAYDMLGMSFEEITERFGDNYTYQTADEYLECYTCMYEVICYGEKGQSILFEFDFNNNCHAIALENNNPITNYVDWNFTVDMLISDFWNIGYTDFIVEYDSVTERYSMRFSWIDDNDEPYAYCDYVYNDSGGENICAFVELRLFEQ